MNLKTPTIPEIRKTITALVGAIATGVNLGLVHGTALIYLQAVIAFLTTVGVYAVPNAASVALSPAPVPAGPITPLSPPLAGVDPSQPISSAEMNADTI